MKYMASLVKHVLDTMNSADRLEDEHIELKKRVQAALPAHDAVCERIMSGELSAQDAVESLQDIFSSVKDWIRWNC